MHFEFLVEELSAEKALRNILPRIFEEGLTFDIHPYQGKPDLLKKLPSRLRAYARYLPADWRIVVLIDQDQQSCKELKRRLETMAEDAKLLTKSNARAGQSFQVINRIAIEELEAWFFGDSAALMEAYPQIPRNLCRSERYRDPDAITGGTWESLERILQKAGYYRSGLPKIELAQHVSAHMIPERNTSRSFQEFHKGLLACLE